MSAWISSMFNKLAVSASQNGTNTTNNANNTENQPETTEKHTMDIEITPLCQPNVIDVKRYCKYIQTKHFNLCDYVNSSHNTITKSAILEDLSDMFEVYTNNDGFLEFKLKAQISAPDISSLSYVSIHVNLHFYRPCSLCCPENWIFNGSEYDPKITRLYAAMDGCIPSSTLLSTPKFIIPWRYTNKRTGDVVWKIYHLQKEFIKGAEQYFS
jgi:hypothetical protein